MSFKKTWDMGYGCDSIVTRENSSLAMLEADMLRLRRGESKTYDENDRECALIILGGKCSVAGQGFEFGVIGERAGVFGGCATAAYIPRGREYTVTADTDVSIAVFKSPAEKDFEPVLVRPKDVVIKDFGRDGWQRRAHFIIDERIDANLLYVGEAYVKSGMWASYPPHKHDEDNMPAEGILEEIYYYEFDRPAGFGIQRVYAGDMDETYTVKTGDIVEIPRGYHPFCCAPGYNAYYLWAMAGRNRGFFMTTEERHRWLVK